ncbi:MAG: DNA polymerase III subunit chi [Pseudomonadales bacterium]
MMTKVDFYILPNSTIEQRHLFACRLVEKAYKLGHQIYIHSDDEAQTNALDQLLWSWRNSSFIPHQVEQTTIDNHERVQVGYNTANGSAANHNDLMINVSNAVPEFFSRFERVAEIVIQKPSVTDSTRANYRFYRDRGYPLKTHDLRK